MVSNYAYPNPNYIQSPQFGYDRMQPFNAYMQPSNLQGGQLPKLKGRPVSCFEEAQGFAIDMDGSLHIFPDVANKRIYTKQLLNDGSCPVKCYMEQPIPAPTQTQTQTSQEPQTPVSNKIIEELQDKVAKLEQQLKGLTNESKSNATVPNVRTA